MKKFLHCILALTLLASFAPSFSDCGCGCGNNGCTSGCGCGSCGDCNNCGCCCLNPCDGAISLGYRSQSFNQARQISGEQQFINQFGKEATYGKFSLALEYTRSFKPEYLAQYFFGCDLDCCNTLYVQGSNVTNRNSKAWLADYFGLPTFFNSKVTFCPRIQNVLVDMNLHLSLEDWAKGLYLKIFSPLTWTKWELNMQECIKDQDNNPDPAYLGFGIGYMNEDGVKRDLLPQSFQEAVSGTVVFGDMKEAIKYGRMTNCPLTKVGLADLRMSFGWNFVLKEDYHFGLFLQAAFPTGNRLNSCYLFEPQVGNGHHFELGGGLTSSWIFWRSKEHDDRHIGMWLDAVVTHMFKDCQCRSFDFCNKPNSRYMLLEEMGTNSNSINAMIDSTSTPVTYQYKGNLVPAINWSTFKVETSIGVQADIMFKLGYTRENWNFDLGYNLWARSGEKYCLDCCCNNNCCDSCCTCTPSCTPYAIKGNAQVYGFEHPGTIGVAISATESAADIHNGTNTQLACQDTYATNSNVDNPYKALQGANYLSCDSSFTNTVMTSQPSILVTKNNLNMNNSPRAITNKIFGSITHAWKDREDNWVPFLGAGFEVEMALNNCCDNCCGSCCGSCSSCTTPSTTACNSSCCSSCSSCNSSCGCNSCGSCDSCCCPTKKSGVYQYGIWLKGGVAFN